jgi:DNA-binding MarR family transcriptional regulator
MDQGTMNPTAESDAAPTAPTHTAQPPAAQPPAAQPPAAQTRWLDGQEQDVWREYLRATRLLEGVLDHDLQAHGLQLSEYEILSMLSEQPDRRLRMSVIADFVVQSRSRLTHTAGRLESRGWVRREACAGDRRGVELVLTDTGFAEITRMAPTHVASVRANLLDHLSREDLVALGRAMAAISNGILSTGVCDEVRGAQELGPEATT